MLPAQETALEVRVFRRAFGRLSWPHREMLVLIAVEGLPYEREAELCGCEVGTVKSRVNRPAAFSRGRCSTTEQETSRRKRRCRPGVVGRQDAH
jgi:RNA polymerase sigma-70 factor (ECF subfamily)